MKYTFPDERKSVEVCRRSGMFDDWPADKVEAFVKHQNELRASRKRSMVIGDHRPPTLVKPPCASKVCRLGDRTCENYWSCRDTCKIIGERLTSMDKCPET